MLKIGDFSRLSQVSIKTLRHYDEIGLLKPAEIDRFTAYRYYTLDQLPRLNRILVLKDLGLSLDQIAEMLDDNLNVDEIRGMLRLKQSELQEHIETAQARLTRLKMRLKQIEMENKMPDYEIVIKKIEAQHVLSMRRIVPNLSGIGQVFTEMREFLQGHNVKQTGSWIGLYHHAGYRDHDMDFELAVPIEDVIATDNLQVVLRTIPAIESAITAIWQGSYAELGTVYTGLNTYLHEHRHHYLGPAREVYMRGPDETDDSADYLTEIQYPVGEFSTEIPVDGLELPLEWKDSRPMRLEHLPFTRRARTALELAKIEASTLEQVEVNPVNIFLGLLRESEGFAAQVMTSLDVTIEQVRAILPQGQSQFAEPVITDSARQIVAFATMEAQELVHDYVGTEHLLLGLIHKSDLIPDEVLSSLGITAQEIREAVLGLLKQ